MAELPDLGKATIIILSKNQAIKDFLFQLYKKNRLSNAREWQPIRIPFWTVTECILKDTDETDEIADNPEGDPDYGEFKKLIFTVLVESSDMRNLIRLTSKETFDALLDIIIEIPLRILIDTIFNKPVKALEKRRLTPTNWLQQQYIDGKLLTINEILFEEYYAKHFDEKEWMEKHRLTWEPKDKQT